MKRLEIIHLRSSGEAMKSLPGHLTTSIRTGDGDGEVVTLFRRQGLESDLAVHVLHRGGAGEPGPSDLALRLASALRAYGLVEHTLWEELA